MRSRSSPPASTFTPAADDEEQGISWSVLAFRDPDNTQFELMRKPPRP